MIENNFLNINNNIKLNEENSNSRIHKSKIEENAINKMQNSKKEKEKDKEKDIETLFIEEKPYSGKST